MVNLKTLKLRDLPLSNFSGTSRQVFDQLAYSQTRLQHFDHLIGTDSYLCAQRYNLADRTLQRFFLRGRERLGWIMTCRCGEILLYGHGNTPRLCESIERLVARLQDYDPPIHPPAL